MNFIYLLFYYWVNSVFFKSVKIKVKLKFTLEQATKAQWG
jgi:hypothetical protein